MTATPFTCGSKRVEIDPPKGLNPTKALEGACLLQEAGVDFINVADSPMARVRMIPSSF
jgi:homocysteine S-methyltransferase